MYNVYIADFPLYTNTKGYNAIKHKGPGEFN